MKLFVTGGTGFVGSYFLNECFKANVSVKALKRNGSKPVINLIEEPEWVEKDLSTISSQDLKDCNVLVHFAAHSANKPYDTLDNCIKWNVLESLSLFNKAYEAGIQKFIIAGTCFEYGKSGERYDFIPVEAPLEPVNSYAISKAMASVVSLGWATLNKVNLKLLRIFQVYGEGELESRLWPSLKSAAEDGDDFEMTKGEQIRDFIHVQDVAKQFLNELDFSNMNEEFTLTKNIGSGNPKSVREFSEFWWNKWNAQGELKIGALPYSGNEVMRFVPEV